MNFEGNSGSSYKKSDRNVNYVRRYIVHSSKEGKGDLNWGLKLWKILMLTGNF